MHLIKNIGLAACLTASLFLSCSAMASSDDLSKDFATPPHEAKPWVYWWFQGGYGDPVGMAKDIAAMKEKGIGGVMHMQTCNASGIPLPLQPRMLSPEWDAWFGAMLKIAHEGGMTLSASILDGWSHGGGWVGKEAGAKQLVHAEMQVDGPGRIGDPLPMPLTRLGVYHEVAVVAFREPAGHPPVPLQVQGSDVAGGYCGQQYWPAAHAVDGDPETFVRMSRPAAKDKPLWLETTYARPIIVTGAFIAGSPTGGPAVCELQCSEDGKTFTPVIPVAMAAGEQKRVSFAPVTARVFRLVITKAHAPDLQLAEFQMLRSGDEPRLRAGIKDWDLKSANFGGGWGGWPKDLNQAMEDEYTAPEASDVAAKDVVDLSAHLQADGRLDWTFPEGRWTVLRFGWTPIAESARMGNGGGYEVDVLNTKGADLMMDAAGQHMRDLSVKYAGGAPIAFHTDSWEIGAGHRGQQPTWTDDFREQFKQRRGYDLLPYLPAMARRLVDSRATTGRFLADFRTTVSDLLTAYYGRFQERAHALNGSVNPESGYGSFPHPHMDGLEVFGRADRPMAEFWHPYPSIASAYLQEIDVMRTAASSARIYGHRFVQAETLTFSRLKGIVTPPANYRKTLHAAWARGLNQAVVCLYTHQPTENKPGLVFYDILNRHFSWWPLADGFVGYMGRAQYLLQQGDFVADAAYFVGEGASRFVPGKNSLRPALPASYDYDGINAEVLKTRARVKDGRLVLPAVAGAPSVEPGSGPSYRYLVLSDPQCTTMTVATLSRIHDLVQEGLTLVGKRPVRTPGLGDLQRNEQELKRHADALWGEQPTESGERTVGKGRVLWGRSMAEIFAQDRMLPDVEYRLLAGKVRPNIAFLHRKVPGKEIFFLANESNADMDVAVTLRAKGSVVELFDPLDGSTRVLPDKSVEPDGRLTVPLRFTQDQAFFVVVHNESRPTPAVRNIPELAPVATLSGPWQVSFDAAWVKPLPAGNPVGVKEVSLTFPTLTDWTQHPEAGIKSYSGIATYRTTFPLPDGTNAMTGFQLDMGTVKEMARVEVNGRDLGVVWCPPWRMTVPAGLLKPTGNTLVITVANLWSNRLAADGSLPDQERLTKVGHDLYEQMLKQGPQSSGLLGPVKLEIVKELK